MTKDVFLISGLSLFFIAMVPVIICYIKSETITLVKLRILLGISIVACLVMIGLVILNAIGFVSDF